jgi:hypothetical protein
MTSTTTCSPCAILDMPWDQILEQLAADGTQDGDEEGIR